MSSSADLATFLFPLFGAVPYVLLSFERSQQHGQTLQQRLQTVAQHQQQPNRVNYTTATTPVTVSSLSQKSNLREEEKVFPKPVYSYSCLIAMAMKNSETGNLPVSEIYNFMT